MPDERLEPPDPDNPARYITAVLVIAIATLLRWWLERMFGDLNAMFITYYPAVLTVALLAGARPGILATILSLIAADYLFIPPVGSFKIASTGVMVSSAIFTAMGCAMSLLASRVRRQRWTEAYAAAKDEESQKLATVNQQLGEQKEELAQQNQELAQQSEELAHHNEKISQQSEELAQQNEEMQVQSEEINALNDELGRRESMLQTLLDSTRESLSEEKVIRDICAAGRGLMGDVAGAVVVYEQVGPRFLLRAFAGPEGIKFPEERPTFATFAALVMKEGRTASLKDSSLRPDLDMLELTGHPPFQAVLCSPMRIRGACVGSVCIYSNRKVDWTSEHFRMAEWLAAQCGHILETLRLQKSLIESERRSRYLSDLLESSDQPFGVGLPDGRLGYVNAAFERLTGYSKEELHAGNWIAMLTPPEWREREQKILAELHATGKPVRYEKEYLRKDGTRVPLELLVHLVRDGDGKPKEYYSFITDLTERKRAEDEIRRQMKELQILNDELTRFNDAAVGRELRMVQLKQEIDELRIANGQPPRYAAESGAEQV